MPRLLDLMPRFIAPVWRRSVPFLVSATFLLSLGGCTTIPKDQRDPGDALEPVNRSIHKFNDGLDRVVLAPVSSAYVDHIPQPARTGVSNFFDNILYLDTVINDFLQGKVKQGFSDLARFGVNSTLGVLGLFDVATPMGLEKHNEDFGQTLAVWKAGDGDYLVYPLLGPSSVRDTGGVVVSVLTNPIVYAAPPVAIPLAILGVVDLRARKETFVRFRNEAALDPYLFTRESYLQHRQFKIHDGNPPRPTFYEDVPPEPATGGEPASVTPVSGS